MGKAGIFIILFSGCINGFAQTGFQKISYEKALKKAEAENKMIFVQYESASCIQCNDVADRAFSDEKLMQAISRRFIAIKVSKDGSSREKLDEFFDMRGRMGTLYIDKNERLVHRSSQTSSGTRFYYEEMDKAEKKEIQLRQLDVDETDYFKKGIKDTSIIKKIIQNKTELDQDVGLLLIEYINGLPKDSLNSLSALQFIARQAPIIDSKPDLVMRKSANFNKAWFGMSQPDRVDINRRIVNKSLKRAAEQKDIEQAKKVIRFAVATYGNNADKAGLFDWYMMSYYLQSKDTSNYLPLAASYYNKYFATVTDEVLAKRDSVKRAEAKRNSLNKVSKPFGDGKMERITFSYESPIGQHANQLQHAAYRYYLLDKENKYIDDAIGWIKRSVALLPNGNNLKVYALLLYKKGDNNEAVQQMQEAISRSKELGMERREWNAVVEKMKKGAVLDTEDD